MDYSFEKIADLAKLSFTDEQKNQINRELDEMIGFIGKLSRFEVTENKNTISIGELRDDIPDTVASFSGLGEYITVPKVI